jgi:hypothetical protein
MKRIEDIEKMSPEELEQAAAEAPVPEGLAGRIESALAAESVGQPPIVIPVLARKRLAQKSAGRLLRGSIVATLAAAAVAAVLILHRPAPKDSFDDPLLAYQQVEETLQFIAQKINEVYK